MKTSITYILLLAIHLNFGFLQVRGEAQSDSLTIALNAYLHEQAAGGFTGAVLIMHDGRPIIDETYGLPANFDRHPAFWLASNSKPILAVAILKLQEQGSLSVKDPITKFFKNVPANKREITIRHLLTHTSGLPHRYVAEGIANRDEAVRAVLHLPLEWKVGEGWHYANTNFYLLAAIVEIASRKKFEQYLRKEVFEPVGMRETGFWGYQDKALLVPMPKPMLMRKVKPTIYKNGMSVANWGYRGATGLFSTTADLYRLIQSLRNGKVLTKSSVEQMWSPQVFIRHDPQTDVSSGYGWYVITRDGQRIAVRHTGSEDVIGHNGVIWAYENGDAFIVLSNAGERNGQGISGGVSSGLNKLLSASSALPDRRLCPILRWPFVKLSCILPPPSHEPAKFKAA